jgi:uncharacterized protein
VADTDAQRQRGLMGVTDLGGKVGMAFVFPEQSTAAFYMFATLLPLSVAWFDASGRFLGDAAMAPCRTAAADCPHFEAPAAYRLALEVPQGRLGTLGIGPGSTVHLGGTCAR